jgi:hypothetical protein
MPTVEDINRIASTRSFGESNLPLIRSERSRLFMAAAAQGPRIVSIDRKLKGSRPSLEETRALPGSLLRFRESFIPSPSGEAVFIESIVQLDLDIGVNE